MKDFKKLKVWQHGIDVVVDVYHSSQDFPKEEIYGLTSQMRRAAVSVPSNIAEGSGRNSDKDFGRFLDISLGSAFELETQLIIANKLEFLSNDKFGELVDKVQEEQKMISGLLRSLKTNE
ncbi:four helix bundle protein [Mangrovibacterium marinum]|uniref:Four helix bundle protein n=1 Tax=Mangrovibacterium marinum TaxID=1639118 RepID=A0A2T5C4W3_9BACT|nr:four helix bundle protein [Mangrovibacterium marinum]PTN09908.1 four helix bundle protein [Mangrovibacterium marinum]